jgi:L-serine dehydratase
MTDDSEFVSTFYSIGGGFVVKEERINAKKKIEIKCAFPYPIEKAAELLTICAKQKINPSQKSFMKMKIDAHRSSYRS